jgi:NAD(P)H-nitrite reductase large subunit
VISEKAIVCACEDVTATDLSSAIAAACSLQEVR